MNQSPDGFSVSPSFSRRLVHGDEKERQMAKAKNWCSYLNTYCSRFESGSKSCNPTTQESSGCAYEIDERINENDVELNCCETGCVMDPHQYLQWNGKCAYK
jgi:hypothetical protein